MILKRFFLYSFVVHAFIIAALIFLIPPAKEKKPGGEFLTTLVSPDELLLPKPSTPPPMPRVRSVPSRPYVPHTLPRVTAPEPITEDRGNIPPGKGTPSPQPPSASSSQRMEQRPENGGEGQKQNKTGPSLREKLFDKNIIGNLAKRDVEREEEKERKNKDFTFDTSEYRFLLYNRRLKEKIESIWIYPPDAAAQGIYGDLIIRFTIKKNGKLGSVELVRTSGHKTLDDAAMKALKDGAPFWPLPEEWSMEAYTIEGHFIYTIYGYFIR